MTRLNQVLAIEAGAKSRALRTITDAHHDLAKTALLEGIAREYRPVDDEGERLPPESKRVQRQVTEVLERVRRDLAKLFDVVGTKDVANTKAKASIKVGDEVLLADVPVTYLLFLEKQLIDIRTLVEHLPTLDPAKDWSLDEASGVYATPATESTHTKKVPRNHVLAPATDKHPAQVHLYHEDVVAGYWTSKQFSGALPRARVNVLIDRVVALQEAVKQAREEANTVEVDEVSFSKPLFDFLLA